MQIELLPKGGRPLFRNCTDMFAGWCQRLHTIAFPTATLRENIGLEESLRVFSIKDICLLAILFQQASNDAVLIIGIPSEQLVQRVAECRRRNLAWVVGSSRNGGNNHGITILLVRRANGKLPGDWVDEKLYIVPITKLSDALHVELHFLVLKDNHRTTGNIKEL